MNLPNDVSRCIGRFGLGPDDPICPRRDRCARWIALRDRESRDDPCWFPVHTGLCRDGDDYMIEVES